MVRLTETKELTITAALGLALVMTLGCHATKPSQQPSQQRPRLQSQQPQRPNVLLILADDLGIGDLPCYNKDSRIPMPNLDLLARQSLRFTDMHTPSAVCTPTRYGLLTGRYCWRSRLKSGVLWSRAPMLIEPGRATLASILKQQGYVTAGAGKWHLGLGKPPKTDHDQPLRPGPLTCGFDHYFGIPSSLDIPPYYYILDDRPQAKPTVKIAGSRHRRQNGGGFWRAGMASPGFRHVEVLPRVTDYAERFLDSRRGKDTPFFLYVPLPAPHTPWLPAGDANGKTPVGHYGDFVHMVDQMIGRLLTSLDQNGLSGDTLVLVTSDNGSHWPVKDIQRWRHRANGPWRGQKADIHEGGHRVPFLVRWPGQLQPDTVNDRTACLTDVMATLCAILGRPLGDDEGEDSFDLFARPGPSTTSSRPPVVHHSLGGMFAIREGQWKLIEGRGSGGFTAPRRIPEKDLKPTEPRGQLYDLAADPGETRNLWNSRPAVVARLTARLQEIRERGRSRSGTGLVQGARR